MSGYVVIFHSYIGSEHFSVPSAWNIVDINQKNNDIVSIFVGEGQLLYVYVYIPYESAQSFLTETNVKQNWRTEH